MSGFWKKVLSLSFAALLMLSGFPTACFAAASSPRIYFTVMPVYGDDTGVFSGVVYGEDGKRISDPTNYAIHASLSLDGEEYWPKPYFNEQYSYVKRDCTFSVRTVTATTDKQARYFTFYLVKKTWAQNNPDPSMEDVAKIAIDRVTVERTVGGMITASPVRKTPKLTKGDFYMPTIRSDKILVNVDVYYNTTPGSSLSEKQIDKYLEKVSHFAYGVRFFSSTSKENRTAIRLAKEKYKMFVVSTAWISASDAESKAECDALCTLCNDHLVDMAYVGSETLQRNDVSEEKLIGYIDYVRAHITDKKIAVSTADTIDKFYASSSLCDACDVLAVNQYSYWEGIEISKCASHMRDAVDGLAKQYPLKSVVVSEAGFPTSGSRVGKAVPSEANAATFFKEAFRYAVSQKVPVFFFMAADCWYKRDFNSNGGVEGFFGFMDEKLELKKGFAQVEPFRSCGLPVRTGVDKTDPLSDMTIVFGRDAEEHPEIASLIDESEKRLRTSTTKTSEDTTAQTEAESVPESETETEPETENGSVTQASQPERANKPSDGSRSSKKTFLMIGAFVLAACLIVFIILVCRKKQY